ncbi:pre-mRNA-splicing factor CWC22 homolog isoform X1 [Punica granatum]|uniref:Pre-mRNA-splicing factor CWC22 homolog isoform X1 n=1 Tax=Punica granatum TaxID=22663 RepID=A0A6P8DGU6_PUNGR|nr:pre-mRNA-splicing factor CWC22 homolog isoform X1 [Punica granatum]
MVGKGKKRREKNYRSAHGGNTTLPPPPDFSKLDALPSKLRRLISFTSLSSSPLHGGPNSSNDNQRESKRRDTDPDKKSSLKDEPSSKSMTELGDHYERPISSEPTDEITEDVADKKNKRKRKRGQVEDLRFQSLVEESSRRKERRKKRQKEYKEAKKNKHQKANEEENLDFPRHEKVKFGDVVEAPPKLVAVPKGLKTHLDESKERIRLQAVEAYRNRKGWASRPGSHRPPLVDTLLQP